MLRIDLLVETGIRLSLLGLRILLSERAFSDIYLGWTPFSWWKKLGRCLSNAFLWLNDLFHQVRLSNKVQSLLKLSRIHLLRELFTWRSFLKKVERLHLSYKDGTATGKKIGFQSLSQAKRSTRVNQLLFSRVWDRVIPRTSMEEMVDHLFMKWKRRKVSQLRMKKRVLCRLLSMDCVQLYFLLLSSPNQQSRSSEWIWPTSIFE